MATPLIGHYLRDFEECQQDADDLLRRAGLLRRMESTSRSPANTRGEHYVRDYVEVAGFKFPNATPDLPEAGYGRYMRRATRPFSIDISGIELC